jgi:hypothetical protein
MIKHTQLIDTNKLKPVRKSWNYREPLQSPYWLLRDPEHSGNLHRKSKIIQAKHKVKKVKQVIKKKKLKS